MPLLLIHPDTADVVVCRAGEGSLARGLILDGYKPIGPKGREAAKRIRGEVQVLPVRELPRGEGWRLETGNTEFNKWVK